uniref:HMG box domain-containing protein n=1 Tax=Photinus pyralis TaxID=7054 RepID=A0A1Y1LT48_PHOPY
MNEKDESVITRVQRGADHLEISIVSDSAAPECSAPSKPKKRVRFEKVDVDGQVGVRLRKKRKPVPDDEDTGEFKKSKLDNGHDHENPDEDDDSGHEYQTNDTIDWPPKDVQTLVSHIEQSLPKNDVLHYQTRVEKLNWDDISFSNYTGNDCKRVWFIIQKRIRRFRLLNEVLQDAKELVSKPWIDFYHRSKMKRHPKFPKRPLSAYMLFYLQNKQKVQTECPGLDMMEISKETALMYKNCSPDDRQDYIKMAAAEKKAYDEKLEEFQRLHPETCVSEKSVKPADTAPAPEKPSTPYRLFYKQQHKNFYSNWEGDLSSFKDQCKEEWRNLPDKQRVEWIDMSLEEEEKYQEELKNYVLRNPSYSAGVFKTVVSKSERAIKERLSGKPVKPPLSAYSLYAQIMLKSDEMKKIDPKLRMKVLADHWKNYTEQEKNVYHENYEQLVAQYKIDYATYLDSLPESKRQEELLNNAKRKKKNEEAKSKTDENVNKNGQKSKTEDEKEEERKRTELTHDVGKMRVRQATYRKDYEQDEGVTIVTKIRKEHDIKVSTKERDKKKKKEDGFENGCVSLTKIIEAEPVQPPVSGFVLFSKRYHGKAPVETAWKNLNKIEKKEYETEVQMLKQKYIKDYEAFLKSLSKEQLTAFSQMRKSGKGREEVSDPTCITIQF